MLRQLLARDETAIDSVAAAGLLAVLALILFEGWDLLALKHAFSPVSFAGAAGSLIGAIAGGKRWRDGALTPPGGS